MDLSKIEKQIVTLQFDDSSDTATLKIKLSKHLLIGAFKLVLTQVDGSPVRQEGDDASLEVSIQISKDTADMETYPNITFTISELESGDASIEELDKAVSLQKTHNERYYSDSM